MAYKKISTTLLCMLLLAGCTVRTDISCLDSESAASFPENPWIHSHAKWISESDQIEMDLYYEPSLQGSVIVGITDLGNRGLLIKNENGKSVTELHPMWEGKIDPQFIQLAFAIAHNPKGAFSLSCPIKLHRTKAADGKETLSISQTDPAMTLFLTKE